jgi:glycosyltransferase involved in cell wall biosynthesis
MRLAVNLRFYFKGKIGGMENYLRHVLGGISDHQAGSGGEWVVFAHVSEAENVKQIAPGARVIEVTHENSTRVIENELNRIAYDLFFCPLLVLDPLTVTTPSAVTIPDLQHEYFPEYFDENTLSWRRHTFRPSAVNADIVFTISQYSKRTIVERFGIAPAKIVVVGLDVDPEFRRQSSPDEQAAFDALSLPEEYLYFPANFWKHKNHSNLLRALRLVVDAGHPNLHLALTGEPTTGMDRVSAEAEALGVVDRVKFLGYQSRALIPEIYRHARALVFATRFEGFGIPLLEAFHTETPVVTARTTSCPEIAGGAAILVDERDPGSIAEGIRTILERPEVRQELIANGRCRASAYSWNSTIHQTLEAFERISVQARREPCVTMEEYPTVSIVTPSYNMARFLEATISSVITQNYPKIDYIVMDGGSTDDTVGLLRKYAGWLRYQSAPDRGQADAVNRGFSLSQGQIFAFLNADDTYLPGAVDKAVQHFRQNAHAGVLYGNANYIDEHGSIIGVYPTRPYDRASLSRNCYICQPAAFISRAAYAAVGGVNADLHFALDYDLWIRIARKYPLVHIPEFLATSRLHRDNKTLSKRQQIYQEIIRVVGTHYGYVPYEWIYGYASYLCDKKDQILTTGPPSVYKHLLSFLLGCRYNYRSIAHFCQEWRKDSGIGIEFTGKWEDGWISRNYTCEIQVPPDSNCITVAGRHTSALRGLVLSVYLNNEGQRDFSVQEQGAFRFQMACPEGLRGNNTRLSIHSNKVFRPGKGDYRKLSCIIDSVTAQRCPQ